MSAAQIPVRATATRDRLCLSSFVRSWPAATLLSVGAAALIGTQARWIELTLLLLGEQLIEPFQARG